MATEKTATPRPRRTTYANVRSRFSPNRQSPLVEQLLEHVTAQAPAGTTPLRFAVIESSAEELQIEATYLPSALDRASTGDGRAQRRRSSMPQAVAHVVPTSVGAAIGGFAGDATPATNLLAQIAETVITHPNVVNASDILYMAPNVLYVEGGLLDNFFLEETYLRPVRSNVVGVIIEKQPQQFIDFVRYSIDAAHATCGIPMAGYAVTDAKIRPRVHRFESGAYSGTIENPAALMEAADRLVAAGATAIAITTELLDLPDLTRYINGLEPNPHGGVEALLSHTVARRYGLPAAHAPMSGEMSPPDPILHVYDPREAAELVTNTALGCVLQGLHRAPQPIRPENWAEGDLSVHDVMALALPAGAIGNIPALACERLGIPVIGVAENTTLHRVSPEHLHMRHYQRVANYLEAAGAVAAMKAGIAMSSLRRPIENVRAVDGSE